MIQARQHNNEVLFADDQIVKIDGGDIKSLKKKAIKNRRKRIRICAHKGVSQVLHEMIIVLTKDTYIKPHKHEGKSESFHIIEGSLDVVIFNEDGNVIDVIKMGDYASGKTFYHRMSSPYYHTPLISSNTVVYHEITNGPFKRSDTIFALWAPGENDIDAGKEFVKKLRRSVDNLAKKNPQSLHDKI